MDRRAAAKRRLRSVICQLPHAFSVREFHGYPCPAAGTKHAVEERVHSHFPLTYGRGQGALGTELRACR